jgi:hypothetical protein
VVFDFFEIKFAHFFSLKVKKVRPLRFFFDIAATENLSKKSRKKSKKERSK